MGEDEGLPALASEGQSAAHFVVWSFAPVCDLMFRVLFCR